MVYDDLNDNSDSDCLLLLYSVLVEPVGGVTITSYS